MMWFYSRDGSERQGPVAPVEFDQLVQSGVITPDTLVWREGMPEWQPWSALAQPGGRAMPPPMMTAPPPPPTEPADPGEFFHNSPLDERPLELKFTGSAGEYFRIWIVNIVLTIVTLGIYAAWAKVRTKRYFYAHTSLAGHAFEYLAEPKRILIGNLIVGGLYILYNASAAISPILLLAVMIPILIAVPWLIVKSILFNARNSAWRGLRFGFDGRYKDAFVLYFLLPMLVPLTLGIIWPYIAKLRREWVTGKHRFGTTPFVFSGHAGDFYQIYLKAVGFFIPLIVAYGVFIASIVRMGSHANPNPEAAMMTQGFFTMIGGLVVFFGCFVCLLVGTLKRNARALLIVPVVVLAVSLLWMKLGIKDMQTPQAKTMVLLFVGAAFCAFIGAMYLRARLFTYTWHNTSLGPHTFAACMRARDLIGLQLVNMIVTALTFGLAWPWAAVRSARFQLSCLQVVRGGDLNAFVGESRPAPDAIGEAAGDFLDFDIGFGA